MSYRVSMQEPTEASVQRIAIQQIEHAQAALRDREADPVTAIHALRQRCKKLRALLRLVRPALGEKRYRRENRRFRDLARRVAGNRDDQVLVETFEHLMSLHEAELDRRRYTAIRRKLVVRRDATLAGDDTPDWEGLASALSEAREAVADWTLAAQGYAAVSGGWSASYAQARDALGAARRLPSTATLHEWRKRVKYHRHQCELLRPLWPAAFKMRAQQAHRLSDLLGEDHDLAMLTIALDAEDMQRVDSARREALHELVERRREVLQGKAETLGRRLFAESPKALNKRVARYWKIARA
ncbi:CHAD domain-containing protein [Chromohalobacter israelensis]|uniref:CHAD domain-containing protein n=1 Tax=Chromohalobacter israelensis (strain ATCC BAA-138 / DSM 3043 / CIP 106854 / NCIMB 13768 / 1H11) TaxID=290398 RepID=Q1QTH3_CHRI1|nr:CHAD domain-containing protein [Chromohalobacter salexigens]ABE60235.1 conserved hypothetical protein [Chromohalobacter salexigens DSM 3043]